MLTHLGAHTDAALNGHLDGEGGVTQQALTEACAGTEHPEFDNYLRSWLVTRHVI